MCVELVPYGETKGYIRNVWRNLVIYRYLTGQTAASAGTTAPRRDARPDGAGRAAGDLTPTGTL